MRKPQNLKVEKKKKLDEENEREVWQDPELIILDINETAGGANELFEDESGFAS